MTVKHKRVCYYTCIKQLMSLGVWMFVILQFFCILIICVVYLANHITSIVLLDTLDNSQGIAQAHVKHVTRCHTGGSHLMGDDNTESLTEHYNEWGVWIVHLKTIVCIFWNRVDTYLEQNLVSDQNMMFVSFNRKHELLTSTEHMSSPSDFSGVRVTGSLGLCVMFY